MELPHQEQPVIGSLAQKERPGDDTAAQSSHAASSDTETEEGQACREDGEGATSSEQASGPKQDTYRGVHKRPWGSYAAEIQDDSSAKRRWIGTYRSAEEAARAYDAAAFMLHGAKARTNFQYSQEEVAQLSSMDHNQQQLLLQAGRIPDGPAAGPPGSPLAAPPRSAAAPAPAAMLSLPLQQHQVSYPPPLQSQQQQQQLPAHMAPGSHLLPGLNRPLAVAVPGGAAVARAGVGVWGAPSGSPKPFTPPHEQHHHQPPQKKWRGSKGKPLRACTKQELDAVLSQPVSTAQAARSPGPFTPKRPLLAVAATRVPGPGMIAGGRSSSTGSPARSSGGAAGSPLSARHFGALAQRGQPQHLQPRSPLGNGNPCQQHPQYFAAGRPGSPPLHAVAAIAAAVAAVANRASQSPDAASSTPRTPSAAAAAAAAMAAAAGMFGGRGMELQASPTAAVAANSKVWPEPQAAAEPLRLNAALAGAPREALSSSSAAFSGDTHMQQQQQQQAVDSPMVGSPMVASSWKTGNTQKEEPRAMPPQQPAQQLQPQPRTPREAPATGPAVGLYPIRTNVTGAPVAGAKQRYQGPLPIMPCSYSPLRRQPTHQQQAQQGGLAAQQVQVPPSPSAAAAAGAAMAGAMRTPLDATPPPAAVTALPPPTGVAALARQASDAHQLPAQKAVLVERVLDQIFLHESHLTDWGRQLLLTMAESLVPQSLPALRALAAASSAYHRSMAAPGGPGPTPWPYNQPPPGTATAAGATAAAAPAGGAVSPGLWKDARPALAVGSVPAADPACVAKAAEVKEEEEAAQDAGWVGDLCDLVALQQGLHKRRSKRRRMAQLPASASAIIAEVAAGMADAQEALVSDGGAAGVLPTAEPQLQQHGLSQLPRRPARGTIGSVQLVKAAPALDAGAAAAAPPPARQQPAAQLWQAAAQEVGHVVSCGNLQALAEAASLFGEASLSHGLK